MPKSLKILIFFLLVMILAGGFWLFMAREKAPVFAAVLPSIYSEDEAISYGQAELVLRPLEAAAAAAGKNEGPVLIGVEGRVHYADAYESTDVVKTVFDDKIKEDIILKEPGHPNEFRYELDLKGLEWEKDEQGNFLFFKATDEHGLGADFNGSRINNKVFRIPAPYLIDADGQASSYRDVETAIKNNILTIRPSADWLAGHAYPITLDPTVELVVLDVHSYPVQGEDWAVSFTTAGQADLIISPNDQATIDDDEFVSLWCGDEQREPQILTNDVIYYPDWECVGIGRVIHNTLKAGDHTLKFEFDNNIAYAYNSYSVNHKYAWSENAGWLNASSTHEQVLVESEGLTGYMWGENIGWIKFDYDSTAGAVNTAADNWGVTNDGYGNLGGYAWGENIGWINFNPTHDQVRIDYDSGEFAGSAWAENIGWINFGHNQADYTLLFAPLSPAVTTKAIKNTGAKTVTAQGHAYDGAVTITERGFKYGLTETDTWSVTESGSFSSGDFQYVLEGLEPGTTYYIRAYAVNSEGTSYGEYVEFTTEAEHTSSPIIFKQGVILNEKIKLR
jgi:hypothetical protein